MLTKSNTRRTLMAAITNVLDQELVGIDFARRAIAVSPFPVFPTPGTFGVPLGEMG
jgi:hypothetical protein